VAQLDKGDRTKGRRLADNPRFFTYAPAPAPGYFVEQARGAAAQPQGSTAAGSAGTAAQQAGTAAGAAPAGTGGAGTAAPSAPKAGNAGLIGNQVPQNTGEEGRFGPQGYGIYATQPQQEGLSTTPANPSLVDTDANANAPQQLRTPTAAALR
jgi:hypothetical protein